MRKTLAVKTNKRGVRYGLLQDGETFSVYKLCENYAGHVKGGMAKKWRCVQSGMSQTEAEKLYNRRSA